MPKKIIYSIIAILVLIIIIATYNTIIHHNQEKNVEKFMAYINSEEVGSEVKTPTNTHVVLAAYKGSTKGLNIVKSLSYFKNSIIPEVHKKCSNKFLAKRYYNTHKIQIEKELGITNFNDFYTLSTECKKYVENSEEEYCKFDADSVKKENNRVTATLLLKYKNGEEMQFNIQILNKTASDRTSVNIN